MDEDALILCMSRKRQDYGAADDSAQACRLGLQSLS